MWPLGLTAAQFGWSEAKPSGTAKSLLADVGLFLSEQIPGVIISFQ